MGSKHDEKIKVGKNPYFDIMEYFSVKPKDQK